jgi:ATP-dependent DNA helicase RecG
MGGQEETLKIALDRLKKPIEFASQNAFAHLPKVQGLSSFVDHQVAAALRGTDDPSLHRSLIELQRLFKDFDRLSLQHRRARLAEARDRLKTLETMSRQAPQPAAVASAVPGKKSLPPVPFRWEQPVQYIKGIGPRRAQQLGRLGVRTLEELLYFLPWRYEDRSRLSAISELSPGQDQTIDGIIQSVQLVVTHRKRFQIVELLVGDATGSIVAKWFNQPYLKKLFQKGQRVMLSGRVKVNSFHGYELELENPVFELLDEESDPSDEAGAAALHTGRIVPIYHETQGLSSRQIRILMRQALDVFSSKIPEKLPAVLIAAYRFPGLSESLEQVHFPPQETGLELLAGARTPAHQRLIFEEFLLLQLGLGLKRAKNRLEKKVGLSKTGPDGSVSIERRPVSDRLYRRFVDGLPYRLTAAQGRVLEEIKRDMAGSHPMNRLLQGDVGCGKTVVAMAAMALAVDRGDQAALMAPTEILAEQHYLTIKKWVEPLGLSATLIIQGLPGRARRTAQKNVEEGMANLVVGTHALIQEGVRFHRLGLAVIDEQHKFGVMQRASLTRKGYHPDVLVMTATPIPRTLALSVYGDLDLSVIDEMPKGRGPMETRLYREPQRSLAHDLIREQIRRGRQAYVVYPLVEESEKTDLKAAVKMARQLQQETFAHQKVGLLHGQMKTAEKERIMEEFKKGRIQILVATTVVEVGLDIPNATVMLIEHADRFGLAQLHQLRGRIGRGPDPSYCLLMAGLPQADPSTPAGLTEESERRLKILVRSQDGFVIAEEDLALRGPGEFFGTRQSGLPGLRVADILRDADWLQKARRESQRILERDPFLRSPEHGELRESVFRKWKDRLALSKVG